MKPIVIVYATREGHTRSIAEYLERALRARGIASEVFDARAHQELELSRFSGAILAASVHLVRHEKEMVRFIQNQRAQLAELPSAFLSVSMSATSLHDATRPAEYRAKVRATLTEITEALFQKTGWHPALCEYVPGALKYTKYNFLVRWVMRRIAAKEGGSTDTSRDHVYTDFAALDRFVDEFLGTLEPKLARTA